MPIKKICTEADSLCKVSTGTLVEGSSITYRNELHIKIGYEQVMVLAVMTTAHVVGKAYRTFNPRKG